MDLATLENVIPRKRGRRIGRGTGCKRGKTCGRGQKGMGSRAGCKERLGYIGGGVRLHQKLPIRGFSNERFSHKPIAINLERINELYQDGETVSFDTLKAKGCIKGRRRSIKILGVGILDKKVKFDVEFMSQRVKTCIGV